MNFLKKSKLLVGCFLLVSGALRGAQQASIQNVIIYKVFKDNRWERVCSISSEHTTMRELMNCTVCSAFLQKKLSQNNTSEVPYKIVVSPQEPSDQTALERLLRADPVLIPATFELSHNHVNTCLECGVPCKGFCHCEDCILALSR